MKVVGIDPGLTGALGLLEARRFVAVTDMPTIARGRSEKQEVNGAVVAEILRGWAPDHVVIERVQVSPTYAGKPGEKPAFCGACRQPLKRMSPVGAFNFGDSFGIVRGVCATLGVPYTLVAPRSWKSKAGLSGAEKEASRALAVRLFPTAAKELVRKKDADRAEALLLALFGGYEDDGPVPQRKGKSRRRRPEVQEALAL